MATKKKKTLSATQAVEEGVRIVCCNCGCKNQSNFYTTKDRLRAYFQKLPYCKDCVKAIYADYLSRYKGNMNLAIYHTCRKLDIPYIHANYEGTLNALKNPNTTIKGDDAMIQAYMKGLAFSDQNGWGYTFDESMGENYIEGLSTFDDIVKVKRKVNPASEEEDEANYDYIDYEADDLVRKWGNYDNEDLAYLENEYLDWADKVGDYINEKSTEIMIKQVCYQCLEIHHDRQHNVNVDKKITTLTKLMSESGLLEKQQNKGMNNLKIGMCIQDIENSRPIKPVDPVLEDVDKFKKVVYAFLGALCRTLGKEGFYTHKFDELFSKHSIDLISEMEFEGQTVGDSK